MLPHLGRLARARARRPARRLRLGALQRAPLPRRRRGRPRGGGLYDQLGDPVASAQCLVRASRHLFMAGETDEAEAARHRALAHARAGRRRGRRSPTPRSTTARSWRITDEPVRAEPLLERARELAERAGRPDLAALALNYLGIARAELGDPGGLAAAARERRGGDRRAPARVRRARLLQSRRDARARRPARRARGVRRPRACASRASAGSGRTRTTSRSTAASRSCAAARWDAEEPGCASSSTGSTTRGCSTPTACRGSAALLARRGDPAAGRCSRRVGARPPAAAAARPRLRRARPRRVGVAGRRRVARRWPRAAAAHRHPGGAVPGRAPALPRPRRPPAEPFEGCPEPWRGGPARRLAPAAAALGAAGDPYEQALELAGRASRSRPSRAAHPRRARRRPPRPRSRASGCGRWARACRGARGRRPAPTPRA